MEQELMRIGVSLPDNLLGRFDEIITKRGYSSRSEGIRDAIRNYILNYEWMNEVEGDRIGIISLIYTTMTSEAWSITLSTSSMTTAS